MGSSRRVTTLDSRTGEVLVALMTSAVRGGGGAVGERMQMSEIKTRGHLLCPLNRDLDSVMTSKIESCKIF